MISLIEVIYAIWIGILQGTTEWLPVSSKTQVMIIAIGLMGFSGSDAYLLGLFMQGGTVGASIVYFRHDLARMISRIPSVTLQILRGSIDHNNYYDKLLLNTVIATVATGIIGIPLYVFAAEVFSALNALLTMIIVGGLLVVTGLITRFNLSLAGWKRLADISRKDALAVGVMQAFSILPGVSRSGVTTSMLLWERTRQDDAFRFSFILSIPASIGAVLIVLLRESHQFSLGTIDPMLVAIMFSTSFLVGLLSIKFLLRFARAVNFSTFTIIFGITAILLSLIFSVLMSI